MYAGLAVSWAMFRATHYLSLATARFSAGAYATAWGLGGWRGRCWWRRVVWWPPASRRSSAAPSPTCAALLRRAHVRSRGARASRDTYFEKTVFRTVGRVLTMTQDAPLCISPCCRHRRRGCRERRRAPEPVRPRSGGIGADEERAQTLGVPARRTKVAGFALSRSSPQRSGRRGRPWTTSNRPRSSNRYRFQTVIIAWSAAPRHSRGRSYPR